MKKSIWMLAEQFRMSLHVSKRVLNKLGRIDRCSHVRARDFRATKATTRLMTL